MGRLEPRDMGPALPAAVREALIIEHALKPMHIALVDDTVVIAHCFLAGRGIEKT